MIKGISDFGLECVVATLKLGKMRIDCHKGNLPV